MSRAAGWPRYLYSAAHYALLPFIVLRLLLRSGRAPAYRRRLAERLGLFAVDRDQPLGAGDDGPIWVHAVSVGEVLAAEPMIEALLQSYPQSRLVVTTMTPTGSERVRALFGARVFHVYLPWDLPGAVRRFLSRVGPRLLLIMETELWPNLLHYSAAAGCDIVLVNGRLSERSARGYARLGGLTRQMLACVDQIACQSAADARRFAQLGVAQESIQVTGNLKFDRRPDARCRQRAAQLRQSFSADSRPVVLAASTHAGEETQILKAFETVRQSLGDCLLLLAPRHPERFSEVSRLAAAARWQVVRLSREESPTAADDIVICDTMGDLAVLFSVAWVAVLGGSLVKHGGHNPLEAVVWGVPVLTGPHTFNFSAICSALLDAGAMETVEDASSLADSLLRLLTNTEQRRAMGEAGSGVIQANRGALGRVLGLVDQALSRA